VVAQAGDAPDLLRKGLAHRPSVLIADVNMPPGPCCLGRCPRGRTVEGQRGLFGCFGQRSVETSGGCCAEPRVEMTATGPAC
jgi:hypothetical protein